MPLNEPGHWDFYISYTKEDPHAVECAIKINSTLTTLGKSVWMHENMMQRGDGAIKEGVCNSGCVIAVITEDDGEDEDAYFERPHCMQDLRWAREAGKFIQPVLRVEDKHMMDDIISWVPTDMRFLSGIDWVDLNLDDVHYWNVGIETILEKAKNPPVNMFDLQMNEDVKGFVELLRGGDDERASKAAVSLGHLASDNSEHPDLAWLVETLVQILNTGDVVGKRWAAGALGMISVNNQNIKMWSARAGAAEPLVQLLSGNDAEGRKRAAQALGLLALQNKENKLLFSRAGAVGPLVQLLSTGDHDAKSKAAMALGSLESDNNKMLMLLVLLNTKENMGRGQAMMIENMDTQTMIDRAKEKWSQA
mmetsp:Transcript_5167/g.9814  ORF Transcript_5167/g.9814 Transcript_5167/m.9814 type:complete len:364 (+) Transcript_5167:192-1283(+)|eukprot:CAMPEP_0114258334 /NCGR_PEP_ID=MMETSP0058-20121206/19273_1 /TAXON_ID=36894 /ORGANISM="Pyramimonas parkeae, CCMP726" /LENGTH=363 /DNA_ID=CAMNT_0001373245 /DNA_START=182 /DNA_END=1273 /DNA_ORIENTATION=+